MKVSKGTIEEIFKKYKHKVYGLALSITRNTADAEDVVQSVFLKIIDKLHTLRERKYLSTWIYKVSYNEALMDLRKRSGRFKMAKALKSRLKQGVPGLFINWSKMPDEYLLDEEFRQRLDHAIKELPVKYRIPLLLHHVERMHGRDAAAVLRLSPESFKTRLHRAQSALAHAIDGYLADKQEKEGQGVQACGIEQGFLYSYARGYLGEKRKHSFDRHIRDCRGCTSFLKTYNKALKATEWLTCEDMPLELEEKIRSFLKKSTANRT